ncbi:hypothetical protein PG988_003319 [Apiospora saccharicola]
MLSKTISPAALLSLLMLDGVNGRAPSVRNDTQSLSGFAPRAPWCFVLPTCAVEVSQALTAIRSAGNGAGDWHVAIRSGGHGTRHQNSLEQGVIVDLSRLNATKYDAATRIASIGPGARWGEVYASLEEHGVLVTGGREGVVGVGGLLLGGGVSWHTSRTGFACDSIVNYEVVLASGEIINANATSHSDLFRALKGGSSNFGIVTNFQLNTFPASNLVVGRRSIDIEHIDAVIDAVAGFTDLDQSHSDNALLTAMQYRPDTETTTISVTEINTLNRANSTAFDAMNRIPTLAPATTQSMTLSQSANSSALGHASLVEDLKAALGPKNFSTILDFQPLASYVADIGVQKGGNMLGLDRNPRNRVLFAAGAILTTPSSADQFPQVYQKVSVLVQRIEAFARSLGSLDEFQYLAYADASQDPIGGYGAANVKHIRDAAKRYDPEGFFQHRVPGGFKGMRISKPMTPSDKGDLLQCGLLQVSLDDLNDQYAKFLGLIPHEDVTPQARHILWSWVHNSDQWMRDEPWSCDVDSRTKPPRVRMIYQEAISIMRGTPALREMASAPRGSIPDRYKWGDFYALSYEWGGPQPQSSHIGERSRDPRHEESPRGLD